MKLGIRKKFKKKNQEFLFSEQTQKDIIVGADGIWSTTREIIQDNQNNKKVKLISTL
mgnify:CR=1 FL=1